MGVLLRTSLLTRGADAGAPAGAAAAAGGTGSSGGGNSSSSSSTAAIGDINTLMAVDAGRLANLALSVQELWSLPLQILAAMTLLYLQVSVLFAVAVVRTQLCS
jgi:hypothetical protein